MNADKLAPRGELKGHGGWVTALATSQQAPDMLISASRDKSLLVWSLTRDADQWGVAQKRLKGHSHFVQDVAVSHDGRFALSGSWDGTLRLWDLSTGVTRCRFVGHTKDVMSVAFSADNRQIVSGGRDKKINLWNTLGHLKMTLPADKGHSEWVSCVRFSPNLQNPTLVSGGWDKIVKVWSAGANNSYQLAMNLVGHTGYVNSITVSPDGSLCASGGKDGTAMLWDLNEGKHLAVLQADDIIHALAFSPIRYWLCAATASTIKIWDLESRTQVQEVAVQFTPKQERKKENENKPSKAVPIQCISLAWSADGSTLYAGYTDNVIRVFGISSQ